jgi:hypothetical protein
MGIPHKTSTLMPIVHIIPINQATNKYVTVGEIRRKLDEAGIEHHITGNDKDNFDLGQSFNLVKLTMSALPPKCEFEFIDPTFIQFETLMKAINRESFSPNYLCNIKFSVSIGWVAGDSTAETIIYPLDRDRTLRLTTDDAEGNLRLMNGELTGESFNVTVWKTNYAVQNTGIHFNMEGIYVSTTEEQLYSQSDEVMADSQELSYFTLFYYLASKMNILIYFDNINFKPLMNGPHKWAWENKMHVDNMKRLIDAINKGDDGEADKSYNPLQWTTSSSKADAIKAMKQMIGNDSKLLRLAESAKELFWAKALGKPGATPFTGANPLWSLGGPVPQVAADFNKGLKDFERDFVSKEGELALLPANERKKAQKYIEPLLEYYIKMGDVNNQVKDWKTYIISEQPSKMSDKDMNLILNNDSSIDMSKMRGMKFLGVYGHFSKDFNKFEPTYKGMDCGVGYIIASNLVIDESYARVGQQREYQAIMNRCGDVIKSNLNLVNKIKGTWVERAITATNKNVEGITTSIKDTQLKRGVPTITPPISIFSLPMGLFGMAFAAGKNAINNMASKVEANKSANEAVLLKTANDLAGTDGKTLEEVGEYVKGETAILEQDSYVKDTNRPNYVYQFIEKTMKEWSTNSLNPEDKKVKVIAAVVKYNTLLQLKNELKRLGALRSSYNRDGMLITIKTIGDVGLTTNLIGNAIMYIKFYNPNGTLNWFITGFYLLMGYKHDISGNGTFNTEITLRGYTVKIGTEFNEEHNLTRSFASYEKSDAISEVLSGTDKRGLGYELSDTTLSPDNTASGSNRLGSLTEAFNARGR